MDKFPQNRQADQTEEESATPAPYKPAIVAELMELDRELMKMIFRRVKLVGKLRAGKEHAATPAAARAEKDVRSAWEKNAVSFSRDDKFTRQLYALLQELQMDSRREAESRTSFNLAPARKPVTVTIPGPRSIFGTRIAACLAAVSGSEMMLENVLLNDPVVDFAKALNSAGAQFSWKADARPGEGRLVHRGGGAAPVFASAKAFYVGEDLLNMYLFAFLAVAQTGKARFTGGSGLKMADLSPLRRFLPSLGARFAHSMPKSNGLPAHVEASGMLPAAVQLPADLPYEGLVALFVAAGSWKTKILFDCSALPGGEITAVLGECLPLLQACGINVDLDGSSLRVDSSRFSFPASMDCSLDPVISAYLLALPLFAGGFVQLGGKLDWREGEAAFAATLLEQAGLILNAEGQIVRSVPAAEKRLFAPAHFDDIPDSLLPLAFACIAHGFLRGKQETYLPRLPESLDPGIVDGFLGSLGIVVQDEKLVRQYVDGKTEEKTPWNCPSPLWAFAYALCAYDCPNIRMTNPSIVATLMPSFWAFYNSLPNPSEEKKVPEPQEKTRRRVIAKE